MSNDDPFGSELSNLDAKLIERALRANWPIAPATQRRLLRSLAAMVLAKGTKPRLRVSAFRAVLAAQRNQLEQAKIDLAREIFEAKVTHKNEFNLAQLVADAERAAVEHTPAERPES